MTSLIDPSKPASDAPTVASVRANFQFAKDEIEALQNQAPTPSQIATALATINQTLSNHEQRISALENTAPPPPPPPAPPNIPFLTVTAQWQGPTPNTQSASENISVTATTTADYSGGELQIGVQTGDAWYVQGRGSENITMLPSTTHTTTIGVMLMNPNSSQAIEGRASFTSPPYAQNTTPIAPAPPPPPPPPIIYCSTPQNQTFAIGDTISVLVGITNTGGSELFGCDVTMTATNANGPLTINAQPSPSTATITDTLYRFGARNVYFDIVIADPAEFDYLVTSKGRNTIDGDQTNITGQAHSGTMTGI